MTPKTPPPFDRRIRRTRNALREALVLLVAERGWDAVSVQDLCTRADVGRSTFYLHFQSKEELLADGLNELRDALLEQAAAIRRTRSVAFPFARGLFEHVHERRVLFRSLIGRGSGYLVQQRFRKMVVQLVEGELSRQAASGWRRDAAGHYVSGALVELMGWWVDATPRRSVEEVEKFFHQLTAPVMAQLERTTK